MAGTETVKDPSGTSIRNLRSLAREPASDEAADRPGAHYDDSHNRFPSWDIYVRAN